MFADSSGKFQVNVKFQVEVQFNIFQMDDRKAKFSQSHLQNYY